MGFQVNELGLKYFVYLYHLVTLKEASSLTSKYGHGSYYIPGYIKNYSRPRTWRLLLHCHSTNVNSPPSTASVVLLKSFSCQGILLRTNPQWLHNACDIISNFYGLKTLPHLIPQYLYRRFSSEKASIVVKSVYSSSRNTYDKTASPLYYCYYLCSLQSSPCIWSLHLQGWA